MKRFLFMGLVLAAGLTNANAADLPVKAPIVAPLLPFTWTGFYVGANVGYSFGRDPTTEMDATTGVQIASFDLSPNGVVGGGQAGFNYQFAPNWLVGFEGDIQGTNQRASNCFGAGCSRPGTAFYFTEEQNLSWFATARGRIGYVTGDWLLYLTGGGAWGRVHNDFRVFTPTDVAGSANFNLSGYVIGAGFETRFAGNWSVKVEYLYMDLGSYTDSVFDPITLHTFALTSDVRDNIIRAGVNYAFH